MGKSNPVLDLAFRDNGVLRVVVVCRVQSVVCSGVVCVVVCVYAGIFESLV
jgi:hypothetical protein